MKIKTSVGLRSAALLLLTAFIMVACGPKDAEISTAVNQQLATFGPSVSANVNEGVVTISGEVGDEAAKSAIETALKSVKGVKSVVNNTSVKAMAPEPTLTVNPDDMLRSAIQTALTAAGISGVNLSVQNGEVTLTGAAKKADLMKIMQAANSANPRKVNNQLTIQ